MTYRCTCRGRHLHGSSRSIVRRIGGSLPLDVGTRLIVQLPHMADSPGRGEVAVSVRLDGLTLATYLKDLGQANVESVGLLKMEPIEEEGEDLGVFEGSEDEGMEEEEGSPSEETFQKISNLETELARLKAQIAIYALAETQGMEDVPSAPPPPAAPPIPPVPPTATTATPARPRSTQSEAFATPRPDPSVAETPRSDFSSMLQDIGSVKLRTVDVARSPGGTPFRRVQENREPASNDPGAIIAQALRKKFAHKVFQDSPDKENLDRSDASLSAGFDSPSVKLFDH